MPLYEYRCQECGELFEILQAIGADAQGVACPTCHSVGAKRQFSTFAAQSSGGTGGAVSGQVGCGPGSGFT